MADYLVDILHKVGNLDLETMIFLLKMIKVGFFHLMRRLSLILDQIKLNLQSGICITAFAYLEMTVI